MESIEAIKALLEYANSVTGMNDTRLGDAVKHLADGYNNPLTQ